MNTDLEMTMEKECRMDHGCIIAMIGRDLAHALYGDATEGLFSMENGTGTTEEVCRKMMRYIYSTKGTPTCTFDDKGHAYYSEEDHNLTEGRLVSVRIEKRVTPNGEKMYVTLGVEASLFADYARTGCTLLDAECLLGRPWMANVLDGYIFIDEEFSIKSMYCDKEESEMMFERGMDIMHAFYVTGLLLAVELAEAGIVPVPPWCGEDFRDEVIEMLGKKEQEKEAE